MSGVDGAGRNRLPAAPSRPGVLGPAQASATVASLITHEVAGGRRGGSTGGREASCRDGVAWRRSRSRRQRGATTPSRIAHTPLVKHDDGERCQTTDTVTTAPPVPARPPPPARRRAPRPLHPSESRAPATLGEVDAEMAGRPLLSQGPQCRVGGSALACFTPQPVPNMGKRTCLICACLLHSAAQLLPEHRIASHSIA